MMRHNNRQGLIRRLYRSAEFRRISRAVSNNLPITEGKVHFIRLVLENGTISVLNENNSFDKSLAYGYAWATIDTK